jgi:hypothetical protein
LERFLEVLFCQSVEHSLPFGLYLLNGIKPASFQLHFWKQEEVTGGARLFETNAMNNSKSIDELDVMHAAQ